MRFSATLSVALAALSFAPSGLAIINYAADFIDPNYILNFEYNTTTVMAQQTNVQWANQLAMKGPWSVTTKSIVAPSGDIHDYMSWKPYYWPDCSMVGNTTELTPDQVFHQCNYTVHDGDLNPESRNVNNIGDFDDMASAILFNAVSWGLTRSTIYATRVIGYINHWFLDPRTMMNPNLNYAQLKGGPDGQEGEHTGVIDLKSMTKIASGVLILRLGQAEGWNSTFDGQFQNWTSQYITWLTSSKIALEERAAENNHGTFYFAQLAALHAIVDQKDQAVEVAKQFFQSTYTNQIDADGNQPYEHARTRPFHYMTYNLAALLTLGRISQYCGWAPWDEKTKSNGTIPLALDYTMNFPNGNETLSELFPVLAEGASIYGDPDNKYANWLNEKSQGQYVNDASFLWTQPLSDNNLVTVQSITFAGSPGGTGTLAAGVRPTAGVNTGTNPSSASTLSASWGLIGAAALASASWLF